MKADLKKDKEISQMLEGGQKLGRIREELESFTQVGVKLSDIEKKAQDLIAKSGGKPSFAMVPGYHWATCININDGIVHGIPDNKMINHGDVVSIDVGLFYKGFHTDTCTTFLVKEKGKIANYEFEINQFLQTGRETLNKAIKIAKPNNRIGHISKVIQNTIENKGYSCSWELTGHGVGRQLHEYPQVPCLLEGEIKNTPMIKPGMTLAIEIIYAMGDGETETDKKDGWTMFMKDHSLSAVFEKTVAISQKGNIIITP